MLEWSLIQALELRIPAKKFLKLLFGQKASASVLVITFPVLIVVDLF
jgi:hypothetical protein